MMGMDQRREIEGVVILINFDMHIYVTHFLKIGMDQRREKEGVEWLFFICTSM